MEINFKAPSRSSSIYVYNVCDCVCVFARAIRIY